jgi:D-3-phosphoglycerate dehydrogenase / 2-oxoglutarate reductase
MKWKVLVSAPYMQQALPRFESFFRENDIQTVTPPVMERLEEQDLLLWARDVDGVIAGDDRFSERVLQSSPKLKVISKWGTGIDSIDRDACRRLGIAVRNTPNAFSEPVADTVMGMILCFARNLFVQNRLVKSGTWDKVPGRALNECTLGIIGVGNCGKAVAVRAAAFGMRVIGHDPLPMPEDFVRRTGISMKILDYLLKEADFISLNCDLNPTSFHLMSVGSFSKMKPDAVLINTARGPVVDEAALISALQQGQLAGACLDVFETEPLPADSPLRGFQNVLLSCHNANSSPAAWERVHLRTLNNLVEELRKESP